MNIPKKCIDESCNKIISVEENRKSFVLKNAGGKSVKKIRVDGCLITDSRMRCDYLFEVGKPTTLVLYVELKGKNIERAYRQLSITLKHLKNNHDGMERKCYVVASRVPKAGTKTQVLQKKFRRENNVPLFVGTSKTTVKI